MRFLAVVGVLAIIVVVAGAVYFFGGFYDVAAVRPDNPVVAWAVSSIRRASVEHYADETPPQSLGDDALEEAGAKDFNARGCTNCHGAPGVKWAKFSEALNPDPPDLKEIVPERSAAELFWVIKNGIKMSAMPGYGALGADDQEVWSIVAFVQHIGSIDAAKYKAWTTPPGP